MMILKSGCCLIVGLFICCVYRAAGQAVIELPVDPATKQVPYTLRGHNTEASNEAVWYISPSATEVISRLRPGVFRWPGGNTANNYDWKAHVKDNRRLTIAVLQQVSARYGTQPQIVVNYGTGSAADAAELVRFCNSTSDWYRQQREKMLLGDSTRLDVQMWEIGNENAYAWAFARTRKTSSTVAESRPDISPGKVLTACTTTVARLIVAVGYGLLADWIRSRLFWVT
ncbi:MAG: hypothetical protein D8M52_04890 [Chlorobi bacterium]|nr:MAG: hypothetical protein UZ06_CHB003001418 [Chlorobi bacterium OLB6]MBE2266281.1 hypothetical protein [Flavobacteriales bacterium]MBL1161039.1 hypothetical protein [Chlorobiota bacterium]MCC6330337.1 hypothetical protein [Ignavibacteria bacterium]WKZ78867.1 MAG: hypothetical protein QY319_05540 [Candidatus Kapabacteria bacterium]